MLMTEWKLEDAIMVSKIEGREEALKNVAQKMKNRGTSIEEIARFTDLTVDDILRL